MIKICFMPKKTVERKKAFVEQKADCIKKNSIKIT